MDSFWFRVAEKMKRHTQWLIVCICRKEHVIGTFVWAETKLLPHIKLTRYTLPETNISPENGWLEDYVPFGKAYFQGPCQFEGGYSNCYWNLKQDKLKQSWTNINWFPKPSKQYWKVRSELCTFLPIPKFSREAKGLQLVVLPTHWNFAILLFKVLYIMA